MTRLAHNPLIARLRSDDGVAMIVAVIVLMITSALVAVAVSVAMQANGSTLRDQNKKNALEAAEAGLQIANYRLNMLRPSDTLCVGDTVASPDSTGTCASSTYAFGNGSTYSYRMTPVLGASATCVGMTLSSNTNISQRCLTAVGTTNGISARSQIRVAAFAATPLFPADITGINGITNGNNASVHGIEASNKTITGGNNQTTITGGVELGPGGSYTGASSPTQATLSSPLVLGPVDPGTSNQTSLGLCPDRAAAGYPACNDDYRITNYLNNPSSPTSPFDPSNGVSFNAATRTLSTSNSHPAITLGGGIYNFCEVDILNNATIILAPGVKVEIFIDSPDDPDSGCAAGTGSLNVKNNVTWVNPSNDPTALQIYVYGFNDGSNVVNFKNNGNCTCVLNAPLSTINLSHNSSISDLTGAVSGAVVNVPNNFLFNGDPRTGSLQGTSTGLYYRTAWAQCTPAPPTPTVPGSGCG
jgi:Tfp pilus assembly protein PilX